MKRKARVARCYTDQPLQSNREIILDKRSSHHLSTVLRAREGQAVQLFNGDGKNYSGSVTNAGRKTVVTVTDAITNENESKLSITLIQAIARGDKMDGVVQKATELGVTAIQPVYTTHSITRLELSREEKKQAHWHSVMVSACEQSGRSTLPQLHPILTLEDFLEACPPASTSHQRWVLSPAAHSTINGDDNVTHVSVLVGPESGFNDDEIAAAGKACFNPLQLGPRVLRTETAGPASIAIFQARFGDMI